MLTAGEPKGKERQEKWVVDGNHIARPEDIKIFSYFQARITQ